MRSGPYHHLMTENFREIETDSEIRVVVETIGGVGAAYEYTRRCLMAGKHVVTANKQLVAEHGCELLELARKNHVNYLFEASVGGGIPILHPLTQCMAANRVDEIYGILNGTTNFILTKMVKEGASFAEVLKLAQAEGLCRSGSHGGCAGYRRRPQDLYSGRSGLWTSGESEQGPHGGHYQAGSEGCGNRRTTRVIASSCWAAVCGWRGIGAPPMSLPT